MSRPPTAVIAGAVSLAAAAIVGHEGVKYSAYYDPVHIPTICMGHTKGVRMGDTATREQCVKLAGEDVATAVEQVLRCHPTLDFTSYQLAAFGDIVYNMGPKPVCGPGSTMARMLSAGDIAGACKQFPRWNQARVMGLYTALPGLTKRRAANMALCEGRQ